MNLTYFVAFCFNNDRAIGINSGQSVGKTRFKQALARLRFVRLLAEDRAAMAGNPLKIDNLYIFFAVPLVKSGFCRSGSPRQHDQAEVQRHSLQEAHDVSAIGFIAAINNACLPAYIA